MWGSYLIVADPSTGDTLYQVTAAHILQGTSKIAYTLFFLFVCFFFIKKNKLEKLLCAKAYTCLLYMTKL